MVYWRLYWNFFRFNFNKPSALNSVFLPSKIGSSLKQFFQDQIRYVNKFSYNPTAEFQQNVSKVAYKSSGVQLILNGFHPHSDLYPKHDKDGVFNITFPRNENIFFLSVELSWSLDTLSNQTPCRFDLLLLHPGIPDTPAYQTPRKNQTPRRFFLLFWPNNHTHCRFIVLSLDGHKKYSQLRNWSVFHFR